jgi:AAA15 family ATPase/GTPase
MLISFQFSNFLSFRDETRFSMVASRERQQNKRITVVPSLGLKVLPAAAIYGGNGSGKSNFYKALSFAEQLVLKSKISEEDSIDVEPFRLEEESEKLPSSFAFEILIGAEVFKFSFAVSRKRVLEESLEILKGGKSTLVYSRHVEHDKDQWNLEYFDKLTLPQEEADFVKFKARDTLPNQLFLNAVRGRKIPVLETLVKWFRRTLVLIDPETTSNSMEFSSKRQDKLHGFCVEALSKAHTGIDKIEGEEISIEAVDLPKQFKEMFKDKIKDDEAAQIVSPDKKRYTIFREKGQLKCLQLVTYHHSKNGGQIRFDVSQESEGTQRLIDLLPAFHDLLSPSSDKVFVIDELDRSLHTLLTRSLLESYLVSRSSDSRGQLIFTTHDGLLLDQSLFRRDEFWFIDKDENGASSLSALSDFKDVRHDKDIRKSYLQGRFGGIPIIRSLPRSLKGVER